MPYAYKKGRKDNAQKAVEDVLKSTSIPYSDTSGLGNGFPDLVVHWRGVNLLVEIKNPKQRDDLTAAETRFFAMVAITGAPLIIATEAQDIFDWFNDRVDKQYQNERITESE